MAVLQTFKLKEELKFLFSSFVIACAMVRFHAVYFDQAYPLLNSFIKVFMPSALWYQEHGSQGTSSRESIKSGLVLS
jgi:hypothetical protein